MADARSLLKAKRQEARISHPYATYTPSDQLKCSVCGLIIKHASAWEGHLGSKAHRTAVTQARARQQQHQEELERATANASLNDDTESSSHPTKRKASVSNEDVEAKKPRRTGGESSSGFPADFFSDPTRSLPVSNDDDDEEEEEGGDDAMAVDPSSSGSKATTGPKSAVDEEYERFQRELLQMQSASASVDKAEAFARATVAGEEELFTEKDMQISGGLGAAVQEEESAVTEEETEEQKRARKEQEERELIMDRLLEEERLQEDADLRVATMKARMEALKKKREARKAAKAKDS
ncbi:hypothetical protein EST38_g9928 [Candolleomyces aberdarensis]|uniref:Uncharacterized protein n=1 Tax=Candolleomyces aberdarensis TaxID=2316362 RepID=A0A4Q2D8Q3_9AGAR|nr:hypothetical protein EST38_g9928 [Candolleomyces aberdarensis]